MGWAIKGFLWFAVGAAIPVIIHLLHRQKYKRVRWAAMEWLLAALRRTRRRLQFENLLLLLVRMIVMILLALALAQPYFARAATSRDTHYVFVVDVSYSMDYREAQGQPSSFDLAKNGCLKLIEGLQPSKKDRFTIVALSEHPEIPLQGWNELGEVKKRIENLRVQPYGSNHLRGMSEIQKLLDRNSPTAPKNAERRVFLFTDMQRNSWEFPDPAAGDRFRDLLKRLSNEDGTRFHIVDVGAPEAANVALVDLRVTNKVLTVRRPAEVAVDLVNFSTRGAGRRRLQLLVDGRVYENRPVDLPPGVPTSVTFSYPFGERDAGPHLFEARLDPQDEAYDRPAVDNHRALAVEVKAGIRALLIDGEPKDGKLLSRETGTMELALRTTGNFKVTWVTPHNFFDQKLEEFDFVALCNVKSLRPEIVAKIEEFVERGGGLFVSLGAQVDSVWFNQDLARCNGAIVEEAGGSRRCSKCGNVSVPDKEVTTAKRADPGSGREIAVLLHGEGRGLVPVRLGEKVGTPPDLHQSGVPRRWSRVDLDHKIFSLFKDVARAQPYSLVFWKYFKLEDVAPRSEGEGRAPRILAEFDDGDRSPAMIEGRWHEGRVILLATAIDAEADWNAGIPGRAPYIPIVANLGEHLAARSAERLNFHVGEPLTFFVPYDVENKFLLYPSASSPDRETARITAERRTEQDRFMEVQYAPSLSDGPAAGQPTRKGLKHPGGYILRRVSAGAPDSEVRCPSCGVRGGEFSRLCSQCGKPVVPELVAIFGANVGPRDTSPEQLRFCEGNLETLSRTRLKELYREFKVEYVGEKSRTGEEIKFPPEKRELWRGLLFGLLGFLLVESVLAALFGRSKQ